MWSHVDLDRKLSSPCHKFNTVSTNLGTSLRFYHNNEKKCALPHACHIYFLENYFTRRRCPLVGASWLWPTNPMKFLSNVPQPFSTPGLHAGKKDKFRTVFQNILFISQFMNCFITARGKRKIETTGRIGRINSKFSTRSLYVHFSH